MNPKNQKQQHTVIYREGEQVIWYDEDDRQHVEEGVTEDDYKDWKKSTNTTNN